MPDRAELECDQVVEFVPAVGRGGQSESAARWDLFDGVFERRCGDVVAFIRNHQPVTAGE
jgi:hypothetical protein